MYDNRFPKNDTDPVISNTGTSKYDTAGGTVLYRTVPSRPVPSRPVPYRTEPCRHRTVPYRTGNPPENKSGELAKSSRVESQSCSQEDDRQRRRSQRWGPAGVNACTGCRALLNTNIPWTVLTKRQSSTEERSRVIYFPGITSVADPDPYVLGPPGSGSVCQRYRSGAGSVYHQQI